MIAGAFSVRSGRAHLFDAVDAFNEGVTGQGERGTVQSATTSR
jgi:hypothetical protein